MNQCGKGRHCAMRSANASIASPKNVKPGSGTAHIIARNGDSAGMVTTL